jgi:DDE_Tnp_1-associated
MPSASPLVPSLLAALATVPDRRRAAGRRHPLPAVLAFLCCGLLCGNRSLLAIAEWGRAHQAWCCAVFGFRTCTPSVSTLHRILRRLDVDAFEAALRAWLEPQLGAPTALEPVAIDGKAVRGAREQPLPGAYLLSAFASRRGAALAQLAIGQRDNELTQAVPLLRRLDLSDGLVTGDAMIAQRSLCAHIVAHGGQYLFEVKDNQPALLLALRRSLRDGPDRCRRPDDRGWTWTH